MQKSPIINKIQEAIKLCLESGRKPTLILINPEVSDKLSEELKSYPEGIIGFNKILGLQVIENQKIKDFYIVDDRSWWEQKW
jgi:peptide deformylase